MYIISNKFQLISIIFMGVCVGLVLSVITMFISTVPYTEAQTLVPAQNILKDTVWTADASPYILSGEVSVAKGVTLTIEPGVTIDAGQSSNSIIDIYVAGSLDILGTEEKPVTIKNIWSIIINNGTTTIKHTDFYNPNGLNLSLSSANISYSKFFGGSRMINITGGVTNISSSTVLSDNTGIYIQNNAPLLTMANVNLSDMTSAYKSISSQNPSTRFDGPILSDAIFSLGTPPKLPPATVKIASSILSSNDPANQNFIAIDNTGADPAYSVQAQNNWWGSIDGPVSSISTKIKGPVNYEPWLKEKPELTEITKDTSCCSSVLFIPGIESSRLFKDQKGAFGMGVSTNTLWEPNRNDDVRALFMKSDGTSVDKTIYSGDPIDSAWTYSIYSSFMNYLDSLVAKGILGEWQPFGYDWRKSINEVVLGQQKKATTTVSLIDSVEKLAANSKTGKVSIIAHSNGGLVAKYLVKTLTDMGKSNLIDKVISVAVPYLGTPQAIGAILHGDDESLAGGLLLKTSVARQLGENMPSAYSLLPSKKYFDLVSSSTITFSSTTPKAINDGSYYTYKDLSNGQLNISSSKVENSYIADSLKTRTKPSDTNTGSPIIGNKSLLANAGSLHEILDNFTWPSTIINWAVLGWNSLTTKTLSYSSEQHCSLSFSGYKCTTTPSHFENKTNMGDGTVYAKSASYDADAVASIDLHVSDKDKISHGNILESSTTQTIIGNIIKDSSTSQTDTDISSIKGVSLSEPDYSKESKYIVLSTHSPIQPHVYDEQGRHVGEIDPPADTEPGLFKAYEQNIPGSSFEISSNSDTDYDTYISIPDNGEKYSVELDGTGFGSFTFDVDREIGGEIIQHAEFANLPVTPLTVATTTVELIPYDESSVSSNSGSGNSSSTSYVDSIFKEQIQPLSIDTDGDGQIDIQAEHDASSTLNVDSFVNIVRKTCDYFDNTKDNDKRNIYQNIKDKDDRKDGREYNNGKDNRNDKGKRVKRLIQMNSETNVNYCKDLPKKTDKKDRS